MSVICSIFLVSENECLNSKCSSKNKIINISNVTKNNKIVLRYLNHIFCDFKTGLYFKNHFPSKDV